MDEKKKMKSNTEDEYNKALASEDPTIISAEEKERLTREAIKKFKSSMMNIGWVVTGMILLGTMTVCAVSLYFKRRREQNTSLNNSDELKI